VIRFILDNAVDDSALTASGNVDADYPVDNIKKIARTKYVRSTAADVEFIMYGTLTTAVSVSAMVLAKHNFSNSITYQLKLYDAADQGGTKVHDTGLINVSTIEAASALYQWGGFLWGNSPWGGDAKTADNRQFYDLVWWGAATYENVLSYSIHLNVAEGGTYNPFYCNDITIDCDGVYGDGDIITCNMSTLDSGGTGVPVEPGIAYFEVGRVYLGEYLEPSYNISLNHAITWTENTMQYRPSSGTLRSDLVTSNRRFEFELKTIPEEDKTPLHNELISKGLRDDFYVSMFPEDDSEDKIIDYSGAVKFTKVPQYTEFINSYYKSKYIMEEI
jgi:hypothetical protein